MSTRIPAWVEGELTPVDKLEVHKRGLRHLAISVFIMDGQHTLLQRRALGKYHTPGLWANACCTHPHWGEDTEATALRRLEEELGITGITVTPRDTVEYRADVGGGLIEHEVVSLFTAEGRPALTPNPDEVMDMQWITLEELNRQIADDPSRFTPWLRIYMAEHAEQIFGAPA
ncbi:isopentenyl-diphosphate Delta-isomerase [Oceanibium sediminis]|uniref:isopentenyl-diphosphate Delta-isomerase n=1 Tax=Oceanibium sediminis TaxID=2026339 RepID=UPI000DD32BE7|nr:isopentenyl-diphosphate Delta-isomerase [Oceanibium sediminis]